jgi:archaemetzincin
MDRVQLWWLGESDGTAHLEHVGRHLRRAYGLESVHLKHAHRPEGTLDQRRGQHHSTRLLEWLLERTPDGLVLAVTDVDLFIPILTFVFGEAQLGGRAAVVSTHRLQDPAGDPRVLAERLAKEAVHELGHALGLVHCAAQACAMSRSASVHEVDRKRSELCVDCLTLLQARARERS